MVPLDHSICPPDCRYPEDRDHRSKYLANDSLCLGFDFIRTPLNYR